LQAVGMAATALHVGISLRQALSARPDSWTSPGPTPEDFDVNINKNRKATAYPVCPMPGLPEARFPMDCWIAPADRDQLFFHLDPQSLLLTRRRPADAKRIATSSARGRRRRRTKKTSSSFDLASWDRRVALAFRRALERRSEKEKDLGTRQRAWLRERERDACGDDASCIYKRLWSRGMISGRSEAAGDVRDRRGRVGAAERGRGPPLPGLGCPPTLCSAGAVLPPLERWVV
jgi:uncharacterized protein YecT (DUF1311 family)